jgi:NAD(P)-dependent dehydrogenase (short-subunit alcohol dehydrogenase family)
MGIFVKGKVVIVTGAGGGIGRDFALALARDGASVVVNDIGTSVSGEGADRSRAQAVVDEIKAAGSEGVSGQVFAVRANEIFLMSQSRPIRSMHAADGWTPETVANCAIPAMRPSFYRLDRSQDVFDWDPV